MENMRQDSADQLYICGDHNRKSISPKKHVKESTFTQNASKKVGFLQKIARISLLSLKKYPPYPDLATDLHDKDHLQVSLLV